MRQDLRTSRFSPVLPFYNAQIIGVQVNESVVTEYNMVLLWAGIFRSNVIGTDPNSVHNYLMIIFERAGVSRCFKNHTLA